MQQHLYPVHIQAQGVLGLIHQLHGAVRGSHHIPGGGDDADALAQSAGGENLVLDIGSGDHGALYRSGQHHITGSDGLGSGLGGLGAGQGVILEADHVGQGSAAEEGHADADDVSNELAQLDVGAVVGHNGQDTVVGKAVVDGPADAHNAAAYGTGDNGADHGLLQPQVTAVNGRLGHANQPGTQSAGSGNLTGIDVLGLQHDAQSGTGLGEVGGTGEAHQGVVAGEGHIVQANGKQGTVGTEDDTDAPQSAHHDTAEDRAEAIQRIIQELDHIANVDAHRAHNGQHNRKHDNQADSGDKNQLQHLRNDLFQPLFQEVQADDCQNYGND